MKSDMRRRSVAFNVADPIQRKLYEHSLLHTNFSAYVKMLIHRDLRENVYKNTDSSPDKTSD